MKNKTCESCIYYDDGAGYRCPNCRLHSKMLTPCDWMSFKNELNKKKKIFKKVKMAVLYVNHRYCCEHHKEKV